MTRSRSYLNHLMNLVVMTLSQIAKTKGQRDASAGRGAYQTWGPEFRLRDPHGGKTNGLHTCAMACRNHTHTCTLTHNIKFF